MMMMGPKKDEATVKALETLSAERKAALNAQIDAQDGKKDKEKANEIIRAFNFSYSALGGSSSFAICEVK